MARIGIAVGYGTGGELAGVFSTFVSRVSAYYGLNIIINRSKRIYHSHASLCNVKESQEAREREASLDADEYERFLVDEVRLGAKAIFRTSFSAQALYAIRRRLVAVKIEQYHKSNTCGLLMIRDQAQGFYSGPTEYDATQEMLTQTCHFRKNIMQRVLEFAILRARKCWPGVQPDSISLVYKHHLFNGIIDDWAQEWSQLYGMPISAVQPDTTNRNLLHHGIRGRQLVIAANEYSDITQAFLLRMFHDNPQETSFAENVYLRPDLTAITEYQTVHGSADDIEGKGIVNPIATLKAAATILEKHVGCAGLERAFSQSVESLAKRNETTPDQGGQLNTEEVLNRVIDTTLSHLSSAKL